MRYNEREREKRTWRKWFSDSTWERRSNEMRERKVIGDFFFFSNANANAFVCILNTASVLDKCLIWLVGVSLDMYLHREWIRRIYLALQAIITLLKPTKTPLLGLLEQKETEGSTHGKGFTIEINVALDKRHRVYFLQERRSRSDGRRNVHNSDYLRLLILSRDIDRFFQVTKRRIWRFLYWFCRLDARIWSDHSNEYRRLMRAHKDV